MTNGIGGLGRGEVAWSTVVWIPAQLPAGMTNGIFQGELHLRHVR